MRIAIASLVLVAATLPAIAQTYEIQQPKGPWRVPGEIQQPKGTWQKPGEIQQPRGTWQQPSEIQQPKGTWQQPGEIQVPKGTQAVQTTAVSRCEQRLSVVGDALFDFNKSNLRPEAEGDTDGRRPGNRQAWRQAGADRGPHRRDRLGRLQFQTVGGARHHGARMARRARHGAGDNADQGLRQDQSDRAQLHDRWWRQSRRAGRRTAASRWCSIRAREAL